MIKEHVFKISMKTSIPTTLVANSYMNIPFHPLIELIQVDKGADVADFYIVEHLSEGDLVITADIPLADLVVKKNAIGINPRGEVYTEENISERLSVRNFMQEMRDNGIVTDGPAPLALKDKERFANALNKILSKVNNN